MLDKLLDMIANLPNFYVSDDDDKVHSAEPKAMLSSESVT